MSRTLLEQWKDIAYDESADRATLQRFWGTYFQIEKEIYSEEELKKLYKEQKESTTIRKEKKIGRNDPCPCGSGKKYKKCCGKNL